MSSSFKGGMLRHPDTAVYLSRVKGNESDSRTAAHFIKQDRDRGRMRRPIPALISITVSQSIDIAFFNTLGRQYNGPMYPAIFLDRDGVLIENRSDYIRDWSQVKIIPEAIHALSRATARNYKIVIVTNQSAVGRGLVLQANAEEINSRLVNLIHHHGGQVDGLYMCPHKPEDDCFCRKPKPGLLLQAARELSLDLQRSWMIGDAWSDVQAGQRAGVRHTILLKTGRGTEQLLQPCPEEITDHLIFDNLLVAFDAIFSMGKAEAIQA